MRESRIVPGVSSHPDLDRWIAYHGGELLESEEDQLRSHLVSCRACVSLVLDLESFNEPTCADDGSCADVRVSEFETASAWRAMKSALPASAIPPRVAQPRYAARRHLALAASLIFGVVGWSLWSVEHREHSRPQLNLAIHDLEPNRATRSGGDPNLTEVRNHEFSALVMLPSKSFATYEVTILDSQDQPVWGSEGLLPHPELGTLTLGLPPGSLEPGDFRLRLRGGEERILLDEELPITVRP